MYKDKAKMRWMRHRTVILVNIIYFNCIIATTIILWYNYRVSHCHSHSSSSTKDFYTNTTTILTIGHTSLHCTYIPAAYNLRMYISRFRDRDYYAAGDEVYDKITMTWLRLRPGLT